MLNIVKFTGALILALVLTACSSGGEKLKPITSAQAAILYSPRGNAVAGNPNGKVTVVEFFDYQCHYCRQTDPVIQQLIKENPDVRVVYKEFVLFGPASEIAAQAALAAHLQGGYLALREAMMTATKPLSIQEITQLAKSKGLNTEKLAEAMTSPPITAQIKENNDLANSLGINGAPFFIVANSAALTNANDPRQLTWMGKISLSHLQKLITKVQ